MRPGVHGEEARCDLLLKRMQSQVRALRSDVRDDGAAAVRDSEIVIETPAPRPLAERIKPERPPYWVVARCAMCGNPLARVYLLIGSWAELRCHHSVKRDGKRETCGYINTVRPSR